MMLPDSAQEAIKSAISQQLKAFQNDDADKAFSFATPAIQAQFQNPERFIRMVKLSYSPLYRPRSIVFEQLMQIEEQWIQPVLVMGDAGQVLRALYVMERQRDGDWRINGCLLVNVENPKI